MKKLKKIKKRILLGPVPKLKTTRHKALLCRQRKKTLNLNSVSRRLNEESLIMQEEEEWKLSKLATTSMAWIYWGR